MDHTTLGSSQPSTSALVWYSTEKGNLGPGPIHSSRKAGLLLRDESQGTQFPSLSTLLPCRDNKC